MIRLLFDENLSAALVQRLATAYPGSLHVRDLGQGGASDAKVWTLAKEHQAILVSRDDDFRAMAVLVGPPPKVVWLNVGNVRTEQVATLLEASQRALERLVANDEESYLVLSLGARAR